MEKERIFYDYKIVKEYSEENLMKLTDRGPGLLAGQRTVVNLKKDSEGKVKRVTLCSSELHLYVSPYKYKSWYPKWQNSYVSYWQGKSGEIYVTRGTSGQRTGSQNGTTTEILKLDTYRFWKKNLEYAANSHNGNATENNPYTIACNAVVTYFDAPPSFKEIYPLGEYYGAKSSVAIPQQIRGLVRGAEDVQQLTKNLFGKTRYRKDLVKAVGNATLYELFIAWQFRGLVPVDWIVEFLRSMHGGRSEESTKLKRRHDCHTTTYKSVIRPHLRNLDQRSLRRILKEIPTMPQFQLNVLLQDTGGISKNYPQIRRVDNLGQLHDRVHKLWNDDMKIVDAKSREKFRKLGEVWEFWRAERAVMKDEEWLKANPILAEDENLRRENPDKIFEGMAEIERRNQAEWERQRQEERRAWEKQEAERRKREEEENKEYLALKKEIIKNLEAKGKDNPMRITIARKAETLREWGSEMNNCVGGYSHQALSPRGIIGGVYRDGKLVANFELAAKGNKNDPSFEIRQLLGTRNKKLAGEIKEPIIKTFEKAGIIDSHNYWGA